MIVPALSALLAELLDGAQPEAGWFLNPKDAGLLTSLDKLSAQQASAIPPSGGASIAAHVDHVRYGLELLNRWSSGEDPFADADYSASWERTTVTEEQWRALRDAFRREATAWREAIRQPRELSEADLTTIVASIVHLGYHFGAIRQIDRSIRGPSARD